jgi:hypothetical protein
MDQILKTATMPMGVERSPKNVGTVDRDAAL